MNTGVKGLTNEELVVAYQNTDQDEYFNELFKKNEGLIYIISKDFLNIPHSEIEDLVAEASIEMINAVRKFDVTKGVKFTTFLKRCITQRFQTLYAHETRVKRGSGEKPVSYEELLEVNRDGVISEFTVNCDDFDSFAVMDLIKSSGLNEKEQVIVELLLEGEQKQDIAKNLGVTSATISWHINNLRKKISVVL